MNKAFAFFMLVLSVLPAAGQPPALHPKTVARIDSLFKPFARPGSPGYALGVFRNGQVLFQKGYGMANLDHSVPNSPATVFNIASLSKQFTAACIALLILRDSISLEDEVKQYVPAVGKFAHPIRIKHLVVYMTSGIPEYHAQPRKNGLNWRLYDFKGEEIIWYAGGDTGYNSYVMRFPEQELTVVCFANLDVGGTAEGYAHQVGDILMQQKVLVPVRK